MGRQVEGGRGCVRATAKAVDSSTPIAIRPAEMAASAAPIPPGTGINPARTAAEGVDEDQLGDVQVDAVGQAGSLPVKWHEGALRRRVPPKSSTPFPIRATLQRPERALFTSRDDTVVHLGHEHDEQAHEQREPDRREETGVGSCREPGHRRLRRRTAGRAEAAPPARSCWRGRQRRPRPRACARETPSCSEAEIHGDATRRARHGEVDELDRRLQHDARQERQGCQHGAARATVPDERGLCEEERDEHPDGARRHLARGRWCRSRARPAG